jgi:hypothetical protein
LVNKGLIVDEFIPGKAYLIEGKSIKQVKKEIKEWLSKNEVEIVKDEGNEIQGYKIDLFKMEVGEVWIHLKLSETVAGTLIIYDQRISRNPLSNLLISNIPIFTVSNYLEELRKDIVRCINRRPEFITGFFDRVYTIFSIASFIPFFLAILIMFIGPKIVGLYWFKIIVTCILFSIITTFPTNYYLRRKIQTSSNLPEYKLEEYKGNIESD